MPTVLQGSYNMVSDLQVLLQSGSDRLVYATWKWKKGNTDKYQITWRYYTGDGVWFLGNESEDTHASGGWTVSATYNAPNNALKVACTVKPISKTYEKKSGKNTVTVSYWKAQERTEYYGFSDSGIPVTPSTPTVSLDKDYTLVIELSVPDPNSKSIEFEIVRDDKTTYATPVVDVVRGFVRYTRKIAGGSRYKVRARGRVNGIPYFNQNAKKTANSRIDYKTVYPFYASPWSDYSSNVATVPAAPAKITKHRVDNINTIYLEWDALPNVTGYTVEYTVDKNFFDRSSEVKSQSVQTNSAIITSLESGRTWYFRVKATNAQGDSGWSAIYPVVLGVAPSAPTTWSEVATAVVGDTVRFYWVHNSEDSSTQQDAEIQVAVGDGEWQTKTPTYLSPNAGEASYLSYETFLYTSGELADALGEHILDANGNVVSTAVYSAYSEGAVIRWRVRTLGVLPDAWSPWSTERAMVLYAPPSVGLVVTDSAESESSVFTFTSFPIYVKATAYPATQRALSWNISVVSNESYEALDTVGRQVIVTAGDEVYSEYVSSTEAENTLYKVLSAGDIDLENGHSYTVTVKVGMSSGMTAEASQVITVNWTADNIWPNAEIGIDYEKLCAYIRPYCVDEEDELIDNIVLSVYRREYDGRFVEIVTGIENSRSTVVVDPHPALDYARYRIVGMSTETGMIGYYDMPGEPVGETGIVIQWDEAWSEFNMPARDGDAVASRVWSGSMVKLPYNVKVSESTSIDKNLVEYIGRSAPVSYYGTQLGVSGSWSSDIPAADVDTRYALRRLQIWRGDCYVREPNGVGYWASVEVSFNKDYDNLLMPVTIDVTRVEGGI